MNDNWFGETYWQLPNSVVFSLTASSKLHLSVIITIVIKDVTQSVTIDIHNCDSQLLKIDSYKTKQPKNA